MAVRGWLNLQWKTAVNLSSKSSQNCDSQASVPAGGDRTRIALHEPLGSLRLDLIKNANWFLIEGDSKLSPPP